MSGDHCTSLVRIFPDVPSMERLMGALLAEQNAEWQVGAFQIVRIPPTIKVSPAVLQIGKAISLGAFFV